MKEEDAMRRLERVLRLLGHTADGVIAADSQQQICYWNLSAQKMLGYTADEVQGRPCYEVICGRDETGAVRCHPNCQVRAALLRERLPIDCDLLCKTKDEKDTWFNFSTISLFPSRKHGPVIVHVFRYAHQRKLVEQAVQDLLRVAGRAEERPTQLVNGGEMAASEECLLTRRELEIVSLCAQGLSAKEIAARLRLSPFTVRNHMQSVLGKLGVHSKAQAVAYVFQRGLLPPAVAPE
ncbi:MAG: PAS domain-containing protein [Armatimonadetes bacterium]|nr:PAS domain-containing protein [Armatimonadota bacterium]